MIHLLLLSYSLTVLLGTVSAVYASQAYRSLRLPYLRPASVYAVIFLISAFSAQILEYVYINILRGDIRDIPFKVMILWNLFVAITSLVMLLAIGLTLLRMKGRSLKGLFLAGFVLISILQLAPHVSILIPHSLFSRPRGPILRYAPYAGSFLVLAFIGGLSALKTPQGGRRSFSIFGLFFTAWYAAQIALRLAFNPSTAYYGNAVLLLPVSVFPLLWIKLVVLKEIGRSLNVEGRDLSGPKLKSFNISPREEEIIHLILKGMSNKEIQATLFISPSTVKNHVYNIYQKMNVKSRLQLVSVVLNLTSPPPLAP